MAILVGSLVLGFIQIITGQVVSFVKKAQDGHLWDGVWDEGPWWMIYLGVGLLALGVGDTMRVSLSADPVEEVYAARDILKAIGLRREGPDLIACPTCGRTKIDLIPLAQAVEERLKTVTKPITVAVMGCPVNGPGEAAAADVGIAGGNGKGLLFRHGKVVKQVPQEAMVEELMALIETL